MTTGNEIISGLKGLLEKNCDAQKGFKNAIEQTDSARLKGFFSFKASQRSKYADQIRNQIEKLGGSCEESGSVSGSAHRMWMDFKTLFTADNEEAILESCEYGENAALEDYNDFLTGHVLPSDLRDVITDQRNEIKRTKRQVEVLEEQYDS